MAVSNPGTPSLASNYENIQSALRTRGNIESKRTGKLGIANAVAAPVVEEIQTQRTEYDKRSQLVFQKTLEDELNNNEFERNVRKEGRRALDDDEISEIETDSGLEPGSLKILKGRLLTADETEKAITKAVQKAHSETFAKELEKDPKNGKLKAEAARSAEPGKAGETYLESEMKGDGAFGGMTAVKDPSSSTGWTYVQRTKSGSILPTGLEAPDPTKLAGRGVSLTPVKREESHRKEFEAEVKNMGYIGTRDAFQGAVNALNKVSPTNDVALVYSLAKANDPRGIVTDADFAKAGSGGNLPGEIQQYYNYVVNKKQLLPPDVRKSIANTVFQKYKASEENLSSLEQQRLSLAEQEAADGVNPKNSILNFRPSEETASIAAMLVRKNIEVTPENIAHVKAKIAAKKKEKKNG